MRILLVDDDTSVIQALLAILKALPGHEVRVATSGEKALENAAALGGVDLLISDVVMEPIDGFVLRAELLKSYPKMRTILITGYDLSDYEALIGGDLVLMKPVDTAVLIAAIKPVVAPVVQPVARPPVAAATGILPQARVSAGTHLPAQPFVAPQPRHAAASSTASARISLPESPASASPSAVSPSSHADSTLDAADVHGDGPSESLIGQTVGAYQVLSQLGGGRWGSIYAAVQISINRPVALRVLDPRRAKEATTKSRFIADARAKANVQHPSILSVYEAGESEGRIFYAHEFVDGRNIAEMQENGQVLDELTALKVMRSVAEGLAYLSGRTIPHTPLVPSSIYLGVDGHPRLSNLATEYSEAYLTPEHEMQSLGKIMLSVLPPELTPGLKALIGRMVQSGPNALTTWGAFLQGLKALEPKVVPVEAAKISAQDRAAIAAVEAARRQQKKSLWMTVGSMTVTLLVVAYVIYAYVFKTNERFLQAQIEVPGGQYIVGAGDKVRLDTFWIDKYEVSIGQYAKFIEYLDLHPTAEAELNHPRQPRHISHKSEAWSIYYERAKRGLPVRSVAIDLNSPALELTWWDAFAYAAWLGRELPTEAQWEAAGRGAKGFLYPWGDDFDPASVNSNADHNPALPGEKGKVDGYNFWNSVDKVKGDKSPFGVVGLAGNVSEWTATWTPDNRFPIVKGGNFMSADVRLDRRVADRDPAKGEDFIGFRTISKTPPK